MGSVTDIAPDWMTFHNADDWGLEWQHTSGPDPIQMDRPEGYIHHGAGGRFAFDHEEAMRRLQSWYHNTKKYNTIAYSVMVHRNTRDNTIGICEARGPHRQAATWRRNDVSKAVCIFGYFHPGHDLSEHPTDREIEGAAWAVAWCIEKGWVSENGLWRAHRDNPAQQEQRQTACPGNFLYPHVPYIIERSTAILDQAKEQPMNAVEPYRLYDSRLTDEGKPFTPGETRLVQVPHHREVLVNITAASDQRYGRGYLSANDPHGRTAVVNYSPDDRVENNTVQVSTEDGHFSITNHVGVTHVIVDVFATKPR